VRIETQCGEERLRRDLLVSSMKNPKQIVQKKTHGVAKKKKRQRKRERRQCGSSRVQERGGASGTTGGRVRGVKKQRVSAKTGSRRGSSRKREKKKGQNEKKKAREGKGHRKSKEREGKIAIGLLRASC